MTDFKIRAIRNAKAPYTNINVVEGDILPFVSNSFSAYGEPWVLVKHPLARGGEVYFEAKDFETIATEFKAGDLVTLRHGARSYLGIAFPRGQVFQLAMASVSVPGCFTATTIPDGRRGQWLLREVDLEPVSVCSDVPKGVNTEKLREMAKKPPSPPGWTFRAAPSDFDGPRILRELEAQGAQYAVIVWGKGEHDRIAVLSQDMFNRTDGNLPDYEGPDAVFTSYSAVEDFGPGKQLEEARSLATQGWHSSTNADGTPCKLRALRGLVSRLDAWEQANAKMRVYVAYGQAGDK